MVGPNNTSGVGRAPVTAPCSAVVDAELREQGGDKDRVSYLADVLGGVMHQRFEARGMSSYMPESMEHKLVRTIAQGMIDNEHLGVVDLVDVATLRGRWSYNEIMERVFKTLKNRKVDECTFFNNLADAVRKEPMLVVMWHFASKGMSPYSRPDVFRPGLNAVIKAVRQSELGTWKGNEMWLVDMDAVEPVPDASITKAFEELARSGRKQPISVFLDAYVNAQPDRGGSVKSDRCGNAKRYERSLPRNHCGRGGLVDTIAKRVPGFLRLRVFQIG